MRKQLLLIGAILVLVLAASAVAADVTGKWVAEQQGPDGQARTTTFNFKVAGAALTGTVSGRQGDTEITEGKVNGDEISFVVIRKFGENEMKMVYKGKVAGDEITFTTEMQGGMGGPGGPGGPGGGPGGGMGAPAGGPGGGMGGPGGGMGGPRPPLVAKRAK